MSTLSEAIAFHQQGEWEKAEALYLSLLQENPDNVDVLHLVGILYGQIAQYEIAEEYLERVLILSPHNATYHNSLANIKKHLGDVEGAIQHYQSAIELNPNSTIAYNNLAFLQTVQGQLDSAKMNAEKALEINPNNAESHYTLGLIALKRDDISEAISQLRQTIEINPRHLQALYTLAQQLQQSQDPDNLSEAILHYRALLEIQPNFTDALANYASALLTQNNLDEAIKILFRVIEIDPEHYEAHYNLACTFLDQQKIQQALKHFIKAIAKKPSPEAYYNIGVIYSYQDRHDDALNYLIKAIDANPEYFAAYNNLGAVYLKLEKIPKAIESFSAALKLQPNNQEIAYILSALKQETTHDRAPQDYIEHLFDQYAPYFDHHLVEQLKYQSPQLIYEAVMAVIKDDLHLRPILDLGCGTGLAGALFSDLGSPLIGVDLSPRMIQKLEEKNIYDKLIVADLLEALKTNLNNELIIAADVLTYLGDLSNLFVSIKKALNPNGLFAFTVEIAPPSVSTYILQTSIRYAHNPTYIESLASQHQLNLLTKQKITLRLQHNRPLEGLLYIFRR